jgi:hypothetical protein
MDFSTDLDRSRWMEKTCQKIIGFHKVLKKIWGLQITSLIFHLPRIQKFLKFRAILISDRHPYKKIKINWFSKWRPHGAASNVTDLNCISQPRGSLRAVDFPVR